MKHSKANRRQFLTVAGCLPAVLLQSAQSRAAAPNAIAPNAPQPGAVQPHTVQRDGSTFVLIHGAWHSSFCWNGIADRLRAAGHQVIAIDLPGARHPYAVSEKLFRGLPGRI